MTKEEKPVPKSEEEIIEGEVVESESELESTPSEDEVAVEIGPDEIVALMEELEQAQTKAQEYFEGWQRERADFSNYKRRVERDQQLMAYTVKSEIVKKYLTIADDMERALKARPTDGTAAVWSNGVELIYRKLVSILEAEGVIRIPAENEEFDPSRHEAISYEENPDHKGGEIIEVVQQGYTLGDRVIRPAMVRVARG
jgi:molecular chaperone GrpE